MIPGDRRPGTAACAGRSFGLPQSKKFSRSKAIKWRVLGDKSADNGDNLKIKDLATFRSRPRWDLGKIACDYIALVRFADSIARWLRTAAAGACRCGMVVSRAEGFRGLRGPGGEGRNQRGQGSGADPVQCEIRRAPQAGWRLHLLRLHAEPQLRYCRSQPDTGRTEIYRSAIHA